MRGRGLTISTGVLALIGLALLVFESVQAMRGQVLGTVGTTLLFVGLGLIVVAGVLLVIGVFTEPMAAGASAGSVTPDQAPDDASPQAATAATIVDTEADAAAGWTVLCRADCAGRYDAGETHETVRRGATLVVYREGVLIGLGKRQQHRSWTHVTGIAALLGGNQAKITVQFDSGADGADSAEAVFTGKNGDLAPVATALVSAAPDSLVSVTYS
jgi:hypothetical protein